MRDAPGCVRSLESASTGAAIIDGTTATPWHREVDGRVAAASAPVTARTLALLGDVGALSPSVPPHPPTAPGDDGWTVDAFVVVLDRRAPAELADGDPWMDRGRAALWGYRMVEPAIVRGVWWADTPLPGRRIVQEGRFGPLRLRMATEVVAVLDGTVEDGGRRATVVGFEYRTLDGHLEEGWQSWQLWRWHDTGVLEHHGHTVSRRGAVANPVVGLGMRVFGRAMQLLAGRRSTARLALLVGGTGDLDRGAGGRAAPLSAVPGAALLGHRGHPGAVSS